MEIFSPLLISFVVILIDVISFARYDDTADVVALLYCKKMKLYTKKIVLFTLACHGIERVM